MEKPLKKNAKIDEQSCEFGLDSKLVGFLHLAAALEQDGFLGRQHETADMWRSLCIASTFKEDTANQ